MSLPLCPKHPDGDHARFDEEIRCLTKGCDYTDELCGHTENALVDGIFPMTLRCQGSRTRHQSEGDFARHFQYLPNGYCQWDDSSDPWYLSTVLGPDDHIMLHQQHERARRLTLDQPIRWDGSCGCSICHGMDPYRLEMMQGPSKEILFQKALDYGPFIVSDKQAERLAVHLDVPITQIPRWKRGMGVKWVWAFGTAWKKATELGELYKLYAEAKNEGTTILTHNPFYRPHDKAAATIRHLFFMTSGFYRKFRITEDGAGVRFTIQANTRDVQPASDQLVRLMKLSGVKIRDDLQIGTSRLTGSCDIYDPLCGCCSEVTCRCQWPLQGGGFPVRAPNYNVQFTHITPPQIQLAYQPSNATSIVGNPPPPTR